MNKVERWLGAGIVALTLFLGVTRMESMLLFRLLIGVGFGYVLTRSSFGFAGSVNRAYKTGSGRLMVALMGMFVITAILSAALLYNIDPTEYRLRVYPISAGAILGGLLFGFGMALSLCCASGALTDLATSWPRALIVLFFFTAGVFVGFPLQKRAAWVTQSWISTETGLQDKGGVFFPDLFKWDGLEGYLGAIVLTALLAGVVIYLAKKYEEKQKAFGIYTGVASEREQLKQYPADDKPFKLFSEDTYKTLFVRPWTLQTGAFAMAALYLILMSVTKSGWGITTSFGYWFGKLLILLGATPDGLAAFSGRDVKHFTTPFFEHAGSVQNFGIFLGTLIAVLLANKLLNRETSPFQITGKDILLYAMGGFIMGFGTRLANGCNVGALYSPIATFSLSGWIFLITMTGGGILGNIFSQRIKPTCKTPVLMRRAPLSNARQHPTAA